MLAAVFKRLVCQLLHPLRNMYRSYLHTLACSPLQNTLKCFKTCHEGEVKEVLQRVLYILELALGSACNSTFLEAKFKATQVIWFVPFALADHYPSCLAYIPLWVQYHTEWIILHLSLFSSAQGCPPGQKQFLCSDYVSGNNYQSWMKFLLSQATYSEWFAQQTQSSLSSTLECHTHMMHFFIPWTSERQRSQRI